MTWKQLRLPGMDPPALEKIQAEFFLDNAPIFNGERWTCILKTYPDGSPLVYAVSTSQESAFNAALGQLERFKGIKYTLRKNDDLPN